MNPYLICSISFTQLMGWHKSLLTRKRFHNKGMAFPI